VRLTPDLLLRAYAIGIFPMAEGRGHQELHWIDPELRGILPLDGFHMSRKLKARVRRKDFDVRCDTAFAEVIRNCAEPQANRPDTWINPAIEKPEATARFRDIMRKVDPEVYQHAAAQGGRYFFVPALERHRGVTHYYLERYSSGDLDADFALAERFGNAVTDGYCAELDAALANASQTTEDDKRRQLEYHTLYVFQVLTLDRGTTSGLLVHAQNDVGILGSLPCRIDRSLFASWASRVDSPQDALVRQLVAAMPDEHPCALTDEVRARLAAVVREHYRAHPEALTMQASGDVLPPTVDNHLAPR